MMKQLKYLMITTFVLSALLAVTTSAKDDPLDIDIDIPFEKYVLENGLTLVISEDHKAPIVAVNVWYHVGSKDEKPGRTGFAHLFEHLMFNGSENFNDDYFQALEKVGATDMNGTTWLDRTNYFQNVPTSALDLALWLESDRMGHLLGAIDQEKLDEQRGVVQNEKRQGENQPYGKVEELIYPSIFPQGHPYSWTTIGSMEDLEAASLEDVHEWFQTYYGAANAVLTVAGDVDPQEVKAKVEKYFGDIPAGPPLARKEIWVAKRTGSQRQFMYDRVPQSRVYMIWNAPEWGAQASDYLALVDMVLGSGKNSRLYKRLVYEDQIATGVSVNYTDFELAGVFQITADARPGVDLATVERAIREELDRFLNKGPTKKELQRVKIQLISGIVQGLEQIGGFGGKAQLLATNEVYGGDPGGYQQSLERLKNANARVVQETAKEWLADGDYVLEVHPFPEFKTSETGVDRSSLPEPGEPPLAPFPDFQRMTLDNGLEIIVAERPSIPVIRMSLMLDAGYAADLFTLPGTSSMTMNMMDEGTRSRDSLEISEELAMLGASLGTGSGLDACTVTLSSLTSTLDKSLDVFADVILNPAFPVNELERIRQETLARIQQEKVNPVQMALRVMPQLLYGKDHAYSNPFTGSGTEDSVRSMTRQTLVDYHSTWFKPGNAVLIVVGDTTLESIVPRIEKVLGGWQAGETPVKQIARVGHQPASRVFLLDRPGSLQSIIIAGHIAPPKSNPDEIAIEMMNTILGGEFTARINMNLREDKHWAYGAQSLVLDAKGQRPFLAYAPVQADKTSDSMREILKEFSQYIDDLPATEEELAKQQNNQVLQLPGRWETMGAVAGSIREIVQFGLADDYYQRYPQMVRDLSLEDVHRAAESVLRPEQLVWIVVGDRQMIEPGIRELGYGEIQFIDADGNIVE